MLFFSVFLLSDSCKKDPVSVCGIPDPQDNLPWLKKYRELIMSADFYKLNFLGDEYIIISDSKVCDDGIDMVFDCDGTKLCEQGGENPTHRCNLSDPKGFWDTFLQKKILIFKVRGQEVIL